MTHPVPLGVLDQAVLVLGRTGSGKSFATRSLVERLIVQGRRGFILDYTGVWWGLRSSRDGKNPGHPVVIFGGQHADVAINEAGGPAIAEYIAESDGWSIIDMDGLTPAQQQRFVTAFLQELYRLNRRPIHAVLEELDEFCPMTGAPGAEAMIGAVARIFQRGRVKGFRPIAITQRPANLHTRVRAQCATLIVMKLMASQDRKAVADWIKGQADESKAGEILDSLPQLKRGEGWVWCPEHAILKRVEFPDIGTYDSMKTPEHGEARGPRTKAGIDLEGLKSRMAAAVAEAEASDPRRLKAEVARLEAENRKLSKRNNAPPVQDAAARAMELAKLQRQAAEAIQRRLRPHLAAWSRAVQAIARIAPELESGYKGLQAALAADEMHQGPEREAARRQAMPAPASAERKTGASAQAGRGGANAARLSDGAHTRGPTGAGSQGLAPEGVHLNAAQRRVLNALAFLESIGSAMPDTRAVGLLAGLDPTGGHFSNTVGPLGTRGLIERSEGRMRLTELGKAVAVYPEQALTLEEYHNALAEVVGKKSGASRRILEFLVRGGHGEYTSEQIGSQTGMDHTGGHFSNSIGPLSTLGLIERRSGRVFTTHVLFPEGLS